MAFTFAPIETLEQQLGIVIKESQSPKPEYDGARIKSPVGPKVYLVDRGYKRWIPNPATYNNLFRDWDSIVTSIDIDEIPTGAQLPNGAFLAQAVDGPRVYLIDQNSKRWIVSPATMDKYDFDWGKIVPLLPHAIDVIPDGPDIT
ncbi:MAG TPA: hypothetical protein VEV38_00240 [Candidatus Eremiobacteraceae bacterium]|nr:hypothetical protein [Candidatus Eremiobacteraceae bacterium]